MVAGGSTVKPTVDTVAFIVTRGESILVERRSIEKETDPGAVAIPGGHVEEGETLAEACWRELAEELGLICDDFKFVIQLPHSTPVEDHNVHYFHARDWTGEPVPNEADEILWIGSNEMDTLTFEIDRAAVRKLLRAPSS